MDRQNFTRLGGFAGIGVGLFILTFAVCDVAVGGLFSSEVLRGESAAAWIKRIIENPEIARIVFTLPIFGFALMMVVALVLFRLIELKHWASMLGLGGFLIGVPLAVSAFVFLLPLVMSVTAGESLPDVSMVTIDVRRFMLINFVFGPLFVIVIGNTSMSFAAWKTRVLPAWLGIWGLVNGIIMTFGILSTFWPVLGVTQIGGPLTMMWFVATGVALFRMSPDSTTSAN